MKFLVLLLLVALTTTQWEPDFENAKKTAINEHKLILLNFSGSDWCGPCIMLRKDYIDSEAFQDMAKDNLVLVNADFPRKKKNQLTELQVKRNEALAEKYNKAGQFPYTLLLDSNGTVLKAWKGKPDATVTQWTEEIKAICTAKK